jgi:hypothetical protein
MVRQGSRNSHDGKPEKGPRRAPPGRIPYSVATSGAVASLSRAGARLLIVIAAHTNGRDGLDRGPAP